LTPNEPKAKARQRILLIIRIFTLQQIENCGLALVAEVKLFLPHRFMTGDVTLIRRLCDGSDLNFKPILPR
jgi:hypothetical protein